MSKFYQRNLTIKIISILLAFILWVYVTNVQNPTRDRVFTDVPITVHGLKADLAVVKMPQKVTLRVQGSNSVISTLTPQDLTTFVNLDNTGSGTKYADVQVNAPANVQVISVEPKKIAIKLDVVNTKQVPVKVHYTGQVAKNYRTLEPVLKPQKISLKGPKGVLNQIKDVYINVDLKNTTKSIEEYLPIQLASQEKSLQENGVVTIDPKSVEVLVPVVETMPTKEVAVKPLLKGQPAPGYRVGMTVALPDHVTIIGRANDLAKINFLETQTIDLTGSTGEVKQDVDLQIPSGVRLSRPEKMTIMVKIEPDVQVETLVGQPVEMRYAVPGAKIKLEPKSVDISWTGSKDEQFKAWVDVSNLTPGRHQVDVQVEHNPEMKVVSVSPEHIWVTVE